MEREIYFEATNCRNRCFHCYCPSQSSAREMMTTEQMIGIAKDFRHSLKERVQIGILREPLLYPDLIKFIHAAEVEGFLDEKQARRRLYTNGETCSLEILEQIAPVISHVVFTLFGTERIHDALAGRLGAYRRIEEATGLARQAGLEVEWRILLTKGSEEDLLVLYQHARSLKLDKITFTSRYYFAGRMIHSYENIPTSRTFDRLLELGIPFSTEGMRPEWAYAENPELVRDVAIRRLDLEKLYVDRNLQVYPLNQIDESLCIGNYREGKRLLFDRLQGEAILPEAIRRANQIALHELAARYANRFSEQMLTPQMLFEKYYWKIEI